MTEYKAIKKVRIGEKDYYPGETFKEVNDGRNWKLIERLGLIVKVSSDTPSAPVPKEEIVEIPTNPLPESTEDLTSAEKSDNNTRKAIVKEEAKGWLKVYDENGNQLGKATRDQEEAELIKMEYETAPE